VDRRGQKWKCILCSVGHSLPAHLAWVFPIITHCQSLHLRAIYLHSCSSISRGDSLRLSNAALGRMESGNELCACSTAVIGRRTPMFPGQKSCPAVWSALSNGLVDSDSTCISSARCTLHGRGRVCYVHAGCLPLERVALVAR